MAVTKNTIKALLVGMMTLSSSSIRADVLRLYECSYLEDGKTLKPAKRIQSVRADEVIDVAYQAKENISFAFADVQIAKDAFQLKVSEISTGLNFLPIRIPQTTEKVSTVVVKVNERLCYYSQVAIQPKNSKIEYSKAEFLGIPAVTSCSLQTSGPNYSHMFLAFVLFALTCILLYRMRQMSEKIQF